MPALWNSNCTTTPLSFGFPNLPPLKPGEYMANLGRRRGGNDPQTEDFVGEGWDRSCANL
jgi:hypothetical protein